MSVKSIFSNVAFGLFLLVMATPALGQGLRGLQLFAPPENSTVGRGQKPNEGFFFSYDGLYWNISAPGTTTVGKEGVSREVFYGPDEDTDMAIQNNSLDTGQLTADWTGGQRIELGRMTDGHGWLLSFTELQTQAQTVTSQNVNMTFADPDFDKQGHSSMDGIVGTVLPVTIPPVFIVKNLPITFNTMQLINNTNYWSIEWMYAGRSQEIGEGGFLEWFAGPRYTELNDNFSVNAFGGNLDSSNWSMESQNHIIAGQLGARAFKKVGRWMLNTEGRFFGGVNYQNFHQVGLLGSNLAPPGGLFEPLTLGPVAFSHTDYKQVFTPGIELRLEARYELTRYISFRAGWSGTWMDNISRSVNMIDYTLPNMGITANADRQGVFINGLVMGVDVNR